MRGPARFLEELAGHMAAHPGALTSGDTHCPPVLLRLAHVLHDAGHPVVRPGCARCGKISRDLRQLAARGAGLRHLRYPLPEGNVRPVRRHRGDDHGQAARRRDLQSLLPGGSAGRRGVQRVRPRPVPGSAPARRRLAVPRVLETPPAHVRVLRQDSGRRAARRRRGRTATCATTGTGGLAGSAGAAAGPGGSPATPAAASPTCATAATGDRR